jgi:transposase
MAVVAAAAEQRSGAQARLLEVEERLAGEGQPEEGGAAGADKTFRPYDPDQLLLLAPSIQDWVPEGHLARYVSDLVEVGLDLAPIYAAYEEERGFPPYDPRLMLKLLLYGYATGTPSSRKLEQRSYDDVACRFLCADQHPDYRSIARFRRRHLEALSELFVQALALCAKAGIVRLGRIALDGTKLRANASRHKAMSYERMEREEAKLEAELAELREKAEALLADAEATDEAEDARYGADRRGDELPRELRRREERLRTIREAKAALEAEAREAAAAKKRERKRKRRDEEEPPRPKPKAQRNFTDPDSRIMKTADKSFHQCYSGQAAVDERAQVIVAADLTNCAADAPALPPLLDQLERNVAEAAPALELAGVELLADSAYFSEANVEACGERGLDALIATGRLKHSETPPPAPRGRIPKNASPKERMARKVRTKRGRAAYARRKTIIEPVFGQIETVQNGRRLLLRGLEAARAEWRLHCACHNLLKLFRAGGLALVGTPASRRGGAQESGNDLLAASAEGLSRGARALRRSLRTLRRSLAAAREHLVPMTAWEVLTDPGS